MVFALSCYTWILLRQWCAHMRLIIITSCELYHAYWMLLIREQRQNLLLWWSSLLVRRGLCQCISRAVSIERWCRGLHGVAPVSVQLLYVYVSCIRMVYHLMGVQRKLLRLQLSTALRLVSHNLLLLFEAAEQRGFSSFFLNDGLLIPYLSCLFILCFQLRFAFKHCVNDLIFIWNFDTLFAFIKFFLSPILTIYLSKYLRLVILLVLFLHQVLKRCELMLLKIDMEWDEMP
jgi:hypothetical protein